MGMRCLYVYYDRSYSMSGDGHVREHGPAHILSFIERHEADDEQYLSVDIGN